MKIKKVSGTAILNGNVVDSLEDNSTINAPSQRAVNEKLGGEITTNGEAVKTGRKIDEKDECIKRYKLENLNTAKDHKVSLGFAIADVIVTDIRGIVKGNTGNYFTINSGISSTTAYDYLIAILTDNTLMFRAYNTTFVEAYIEISYINRN